MEDIVSLPAGSSKKLLEDGDMCVEKYLDEPLIAKEKQAWMHVLGVEVDVQTLPPEISPELIRSLESYGFALRYIPKMDLFLEEMHTMTIEDYEIKLTERYPGWKRFATLSEHEKKDSEISRCLESRYWEMVKRRAVDMPPLPGQWMAIETFDKIPKVLVVSSLLGTRQRNEIGNVNEKLINNQGSIRNVLRLPRGPHIRLPSAIELNLLGNRERWGKKNCSEKVTDIYESKFRNNLVVGDKEEYGGVGCVTTSKTLDDLTAFRIAVVF